MGKVGMALVIWFVAVVQRASPCSPLQTVIYFVALVPLTRFRWLKLCVSSSLL